MEITREHLAGLELALNHLDITGADAFRLKQLIAQASASPFDTRREGFEKFCMRHFPRLTLARHRQGAREGNYCNPVIAACWKSWNGALPRTASFAAAQLNRDKKAILDQLTADRDESIRRAEISERKLSMAISLLERSLEYQVAHAEIIAFLSEAESVRG